MRIGLDIMGGDFAPEAPLEGVSRVIAQLPDHVTLVLLGPAEVIQQYADAKNFPKERYEIVHTTQVVEMGESPTKAMTQKQDSSIMVGLKMLKAGELDIFMSAGNTGAVYVGALYTVKAIEGIMRPSLMSLIPKEDGGWGVLLDVGANADCKPEVLVQFAILGKVYAQAVLGIEDPGVGLLNIGSEPEKGNLLTQATYPLLEAHEQIRFIGNVEGYDLFHDKVDVVVCDGFTGNVVLKTAETIYQIMKSRKLTDEYFRHFDYEYYGGSPILGVNKPVIIAHGVSTPQAFGNMIQQGIQILETQLTENIKLAFKPS